jgi:hypothetical protein
MAMNLGLDTAVKATESNTSKLVRLRAIFQLLDLWLEWKEVENPARAAELATHLRTLVGLAPGGNTMQLLREWLPDRLLVYVEHEAEAIVAQLARHEIVSKPATRMRAYLDEIRFNAQVVRLIYRLERQADPNLANLTLSRDRVTHAIELTATDPSTQRVYSRIFSRSIKLTTRAGEIWRELQRQEKSFLSVPDPRQVS